MDHLTRPEGSEPQDFHVTRRVAASMFFAGYAVAALAADASPIVTSAAGLTIDEVLIPNGAPKPLPAYVARPAAPGRHPAVIVVNEVFGLHDYIKDVCRRLAHQGYAAVAPAFFYRSGVNLPALTDFKRIMAVVNQAGDGQVDGDVAATSRWLKHQPFAMPDRIGIVGFCWGGAVAWRAAIEDPDVRAAVSFYGRLAPIIPRVAQLRAPVLGLYGGQDPANPPADVAAMRAALKAAGKAGSEIILYPEAQHGFHADYRSSYDPAAAKDAWARALAFFRRNGVG